MNIKYINLNNRAIIYISGVDRKRFLQGLITNDINNIAYHAAIYAVMLNPQGRFLYDFFITEHEEKLLLVCAADVRDVLIKKLSFYKLRAKVEIGKVDNLSVVSVLSEDKLDFINHPIIYFTDPRSTKMGYILLVTPDQLSKFTTENNFSEGEINLYNYHRIINKIADGSDLVFDQSLILEYGFDNLNAIDYNKGCYVGQELTARTHYRGTVRKKVFLTMLQNIKQITPQTEITDGDKKVGTILSSVFWNDKLMALALIKYIDNNDQEIDLSKADLKVGEAKVILINS